MKIAIGGSWSGFELPDWLLKECDDENFLKVRVNVANYLENNFDDEIDEDKMNQLGLFKELLNKRKILKVNSSNWSTYFIKKEDSNDSIFYYSFIVEDVDTTRPWHFGEYDGSEYVEYLDYEVVDKEFNYCELKD